MPNRRRPGLGLLLLVGLLATFGSATFGLPDSAFTPSYFDGQDGDGALWAVLEGIPALLLAVSTALAVPRVPAAACFLGAGGPTRPPPLPAGSPRLGCQARARESSIQPLRRISPREEAGDPLHRGESASDGGRVSQARTRQLTS